MERLRQLLNDIGTQLGVLTVSQRLAIGLCAALIAGSLLWLLQWSTTPEMVPLINAEFSYDELDSAESALRDEGIKFTTHGTRILVASADRQSAIRVVHTTGALPEGSLYDMDAVVADQNPFQSPDARKYAQNFAKGNELAKIIATYSFVKRASVMINAQSKRRLGGGSFEPSAAVAITLVPNKEMNTTLVKGIADLVSGAVAGLKPHNVKITDSRTGRSHSVAHPDDALGADYLGLVKQHEAHLESKIMNMLADIPGLRASVTVDLDTSKRVTHTYDHAKVEPKLETSKSVVTSSAQQPSESGVQANLGQALTAGSVGQSSNIDESETEYFDPKTEKTEIIEQMPFSLKSVTATVSIPRSFIVGVYAARFGGETDPKDDDPEYTAVRDRQVARVKASVERIVMARSPDDVEVDVYPDMEWSSEGGGWSRTPGGIASSFENSSDLDSMELAKTYGPQVGLVGLALISLFMMMRIVRKSAEMTRKMHGPTAASEDQDEDEVYMSLGPQAVGQAELSASMLTGKEVDADTLRHQELSEEVSRMVTADPKAAAELIRRWVGDEM